MGVAVGKAVISQKEEKHFAEPSPKGTVDWAITDTYTGPFQPAFGQSLIRSFTKAGGDHVSRKVGVDE